MIGTILISLLWLIPIISAAVVIEFQQDVDFSSESVSVRGIRVNLVQEKKADVLLLHGKKYSSKTWERYYYSVCLSS